MELTQDEIIQVLKLLEGSKFGELHLEMGDLKLVAIKGERDSSIPVKPVESKPGDDAGQGKQIEKQGGPENEAVKTGNTVNAVSSDENEGLVPIQASLLGMFYTRPEPGAPPYVEVGTNIEEDTTVGLIEVMKLFNAVKAGVRGTVEKICVESGQLVEYGQILFLVRTA